MSKVPPTISGPLKKPGQPEPRVAATLWLAIPLALAVYALSWGPSIWVVHRASFPDWIVQKMIAFYLPMSWLHENGPGPIGELVRWWARFWQ